MDTFDYVSCIGSRRQFPTRTGVLFDTKKPFSCTIATSYLKILRCICPFVFRNGKIVQLTKKTPLNSIICITDSRVVNEKSSNVLTSYVCFLDTGKNSFIARILLYTVLQNISRVIFELIEGIYYVALILYEFFPKITVDCSFYQCSPPGDLPFAVLSNLN